MTRWGERESWNRKPGFGCDCGSCPVQDENLNRHGSALGLPYFLHGGPQGIQNSLGISYWKKGEIEAWYQPKEKHVFQEETPHGSGDFSPCPPCMRG